MAAGAHRPLRVAVAASGGLDSTALLHLTARIAVGCSPQVEVHALHVHHGLHEAADAWMAQVARQCRRWGGITFHGHRVQDQPGPGDSVEAWARRVRYRALRTMAKAAGCDLVLLAHHRRDQAETVWLQALRGAGPAGLAAMPRVVCRDGLTWARPWLEQPRAAIAAYARRHRLQFVADPSNNDDRYARSRLRGRLWPALLDHSADAETALAAVARRAHEARVIVDEVARADAACVADGAVLRVADWLALNDARRANVLRHWLATLATGALPETLVQRLLYELPRTRAGRWPMPGADLRQHAGLLTVVPSRPVAIPSPPTSLIAPSLGIDLSRPGVYRLAGWAGAIRVDLATLGGVPAHDLQRAELRPRQGGEQWQRHAAGPARSLKKQFQDAAVPPWQREGPLVFVDDQMVFVPGLGLDARAARWPGTPRVTLNWVA